MQRSRSTSIWRETLNSAAEAGWGSSRGRREEYGGWKVGDDYWEIQDDSCETRVSSWEIQAGNWASNLMHAETFVI